MSITEFPPSPPVEQLNHKQLKALAKASRPWFRKKRFWALGVLAVIIVAAASGGSSTGSKDANGVQSLSTNGDNPPADDVTITSCAAGEFTPDVKLDILNHSSKRSDYIVSMNMLDATGRKIGEGTAISNNIDPAQSATETVFATADGELDKCVVTDVNRFASN